MLNNIKLCQILPNYAYLYKKKSLKKAKIMLNASQIMLDFPKLCLAFMLNAKRLKIMPKSIIMLKMATLQYPDNSPGGQFPTVQVLVLISGFFIHRSVLVGNSPKDCGPGGQWLGFIFIWWGIVLMGSCPRTLG